MSIADAVVSGLTGLNLVDEDASPGWLVTCTTLLMAVTFALLAAVLAQQAHRVDAGRGSVRWVRRLLQGDLVLLAGALVVVGAVTSLPSTNPAAQASEGVAGVAFLLMVLLGVSLGVLLLRRHDLRAAAVLMAAPLATIPMTVVVASLAAPWAHPAYTEAVLYIGIALLGRGSAALAEPQPDKTGTTVPA